MLNFIYILIASLRGWKFAWDYDEDLLVVWHPKASWHFSGPDAWRAAAFASFAAIAKARDGAA